MKRTVSNGTVQKYWLTGVVPSFRPGISPLSVPAVKDISLDPSFHGLRGFMDAEVRTTATTYLSPHMESDPIAMAVKGLRGRYGGHRFCGGQPVEPLHNPQHVIEHLKRLVKSLVA